jgi:hypothetical protein
MQERLMSYTANLAWDKTTIRAIRTAARQLPKLVKPAVRKKILPWARRRVKRALGTPPGPVVYPIEWTSEKQRRAFFATDGFGAGIPYERTNTLVEGWEVLFDATDDGFGDITVTNDDDAVDFVQGQRQQKFHQNTGWKNASDVLQVISLDGQVRLDEVWQDLAGKAAQGIVEL